jgi:CRP-like cAMP-binding protein
MFHSAVEYATQALEKLLVRLGLDPSNVTFDALFSRLLDLLIANITFANVFFAIGGIFLVATFVVRTIVPMRLLTIVSIVFFILAAALSGSVANFLLYLLALPINVIRLVQIRNLVKKARSSAQGTMSLDWLRPYMIPRSYQKGEVLFRKGDAATEMFLTVSGKFLVTEIGIEIPPDRILGELGFLSPNNHRTQSVECVETGDVLTISYEALREVYFQNPEFGYFFLRLTSDRLMQNFARMTSLVEQNQAALEAATAPKEAAGASEKKPLRALLLAALRARRQKTPRAPTAEEIAAAARRRRRALAIVERHANYSGLSGFIPVPLVNAAAITAVLVRMVRQLCRLYDVPFQSNRAYALVLGSMGGVMPTGLATLATSTIYFVPGPNLIGLAVSSVTASAYTRDVGRVLIDHFESGETLEADHLPERRPWLWQELWGSRVARRERAWARAVYGP